jgi:hypothetical protein
VEHRSVGGSFSARLACLAKYHAVTAKPTNAINATTSINVFIPLIPLLPFLKP